MIAKNTMPMSQPPHLVRGPLRNSRHSRPWYWMRRLVSTPGTEAYCGTSLALWNFGGTFQPGLAVEPWIGTGGWPVFSARTVDSGSTGFGPAFLVGAVMGGGLMSLPISA